MVTHPLGFRVAQVVGISGAVWLAGNIASLSTIVTPALIRSQKEDNPPTGLLAKQWRNVFENGKAANPPIALGVASAFTYLAWSVRSKSPLYQLKMPVPTTIASRAALFSAAAGLTLSIVPFTFAVMSGTNSKLLERSSGTNLQGEVSDEDTVALVERWTTFNQIRGLLPLVAGFCGIVASLL